MSWPLLYALLKGTDFDPQLRNHWRLLCRDNPAPIEFNSDGVEEDSDQPWLIGENFSIDAGTCERFGDPSGLSPEILLNLDSSGPILLREVSQAELMPVLQQLEQEWIDAFWTTMRKTSPYNEALPFGLSATEMGHTLIDPGLLISARSGHRDLNSREAMEEIRGLDREDLISLINTLRPSTIADCHPLLILFSRALEHLDSQNASTSTMRCRSLLVSACSSQFRNAFSPNSSSITSILHTLRSSQRIRPMALGA